MGKAENVLTGLRRLLDSSRFPLHTKLPPERRLAAELAVSRTLLRDALAHLEAEGRIWRHVGQGTFVGGRPARNLTAPGVIEGLTSPSEVMEVRLVLEPQIATFAAMRATADDLMHLQHCLRKLENAPNYSNYGRWDATFHHTLADAAHNTLMLALFEAVNTVRSQEAWTQLWQGALTPERKEKYRIEHAEIVRSIVDRNPIKAEQAMRLHLETVQSSLMAGRHPKLRRT